MAAKVNSDDFYTTWPVQLSGILTQMQKCNAFYDSRLTQKERENVGTFITQWKKYGKEIAGKWMTIWEPSQNVEQTTEFSFDKPQVNVKTHIKPDGVKPLTPAMPGHPPNLNTSTMSETPKRENTLQQPEIASPLPKGVTSEELRKTLISFKRAKEEQEKEIGKLREERQDLTMQIARLMNKKLNEDETDLENISIRNRPVKLVEDFNELCSTYWLDAKQSIDEKLPQGSEQGKCQILTDILMTTYDQMKGLLECQRQCLSQVLDDPVFSEVLLQSGGQIAQKNPNSPKQLFSPDLEDAISKYLRIKADAINFKDYSKSLVERFPFLPDCLRTSARLKRYTTKSCELIWKMILQRPPMSFAFDGLHTQYNEQSQELHHGSENPKQKNMVVLYYVYPSLYHGNTVLYKGRVYVGKAKR